MLPLRGAMREGAQPFPATLHECPRRRAHLRVRRNNNKIMTPNAHPGHGSHAGRSLPVPPAGRLLRRGSFGGEGPTRPAVGREGGREGIALLNAYTEAGGCDRRPLHARGESETAGSAALRAAPAARAALTPLPLLPRLPAGGHRRRAQPRRPPRRYGAWHGAARPLPALLRLQRVGGLGARRGGRPSTPLPLRRRAQEALRVPPLAPEEEGAAPPWGRLRCPCRSDPARLTPRLSGPAVSATLRLLPGGGCGGRESGRRGDRWDPRCRGPAGRARLESRAFFDFRGGNRMSRSRLRVQRLPHSGRAAPERC